MFQGRHLHSVWWKLLRLQLNAERPIRDIDDRIGDSAHIAAISPIKPAKPHQARDPSSRNRQPEYEPFRRVKWRWELGFNRSGSSISLSHRTACWEERARFAVIGLEVGNR